MTGPAIDLDKLAAIVNDPNKVKALPPSLVAKIHMDLAARDATQVKPPSGVVMDRTGITPERKDAYQGNISEAAYNNISPTNYNGMFQGTGRGAKIIRDLIHPTEEAPQDKRWQASRAQEDSWLLYLGKSQGRDVTVDGKPIHRQEPGTFGVSPYRPSNSKDNKEYYKINGMFESWLVDRGRGRLLPKKPGENYTDWLNVQLAPAIRESFKSLIEDVKKSPGQKMALNDDYISTDKNGIMRNFQMSHGHDEVGPYLAYYDIWDLHTPAAKVVGKPYEIYDRIYYDPKTLDPIPESEVLARKSKLDLKHPDNVGAISSWAKSYIAAFAPNENTSNELEAQWNKHLSADMTKLKDKKK